MATSTPLVSASTVGSTPSPSQSQSQSSADFTIDCGEFPLEHPFNVSQFITQNDLKWNSGNILDGLVILDVYGMDVSNPPSWQFELILYAKEFSKGILLKVDYKIHIYFQPPPTKILDKMIDVIQSSKTAEDVITNVKAIQWSS